MKIQGSSRMALYSMVACGIGLLSYASYHDYKRINDAKNEIKTLDSARYNNIIEARKKAGICFDKSLEWINQRNIMLDSIKNTNYAKGIQMVKKSAKSIK